MVQCLDDRREEKFAEVPKTKNIDIPKEEGTGSHGEQFGGTADGAKARFRVRRIVDNIFNKLNRDSRLVERWGDYQLPWHGWEQLGFGTRVELVA